MQRWIRTKYCWADGHTFYFILCNIHTCFMKFCHPCKNYFSAWNWVSIPKLQISFMNYLLWHSASRFMEHITVLETCRFYCFALLFKSSTWSHAPNKVNLYAFTLRCFLTDKTQNYDGQRIQTHLKNEFTDIFSDRQNLHLNLSHFTL